MPRSITLRLVTDDGIELTFKGSNKFPKKYEHSEMNALKGLVRVTNEDGGDVR